MTMTPKADRPHMPGYGVLPADQGRLLDWAWARERLERTRSYWIATTRPDGRPHSMPVWGVWIDEALWFSSSGRSRKGLNLAARPECVATTEDATEAVIVEGRVAVSTDDAEFARFAEVYEKKYDFRIERDLGNVYRLAPRVAFGLIDSVEQFAQTATRWHF